MLSLLKLNVCSSEHLQQTPSSKPVLRFCPAQISGDVCPGEAVLTVTQVQDISHQCATIAFMTMSVIMTPAFSDFAPSAVIVEIKRY